MTVTLRSLSVASEPTFGCLDANGTPDATALSFISLACERDPVVIFGDPAFTTKNETRESFTEQALEPDTMWSASGTRIPRRTGTVSVRMDITTLGASVATNYDDTGIGKLFNAGFKSFKPALNGSQAVTLSTANKFTADTADASDFEPGMLIGFRNSAGIAEYTAITGYHSVDDACSISPSLTLASGSADVFPMQTWFMGVRDESGEVEESVVFRVDGPGFKTYCYGCKLQSVAFSLDGGRIMADFTFLSAYIVDDHENATNNFPAEPQPLSGPTQHFRGAHVVLSDELGQFSRGTVSQTTPAYGVLLDRNQFDIETFSLTYTNTLTPKAHSYSILGMSDMEVTNVSVECNITATYLPGTHDFMYNDFRDKVVRSLMIGSGPVFDGAGFALYLAGAYLKTDPRKLEINGEIVKQTLNYGLARFGGDVKLNADTPALSPFRLGLGV